jgi:hypothetical protein
MKNKQPSCPECEKLAAVSKESNKIGEFLEWLTDDNGVTFARWDDNHERWECHSFDYLSINQLLAEYYDIDLDKVEDERRVLLEWIREMNT